MVIGYSKSFWLPGGGEGESFGPIFLSSQTAASANIDSVTASDAKLLCGKNLDWLAAVKGNAGIIKK